MSQATLAALRAGRLAGARQLDLQHGGLRAFPREILDLADTLEVLNLSGNALHALPEDLGRLHRLRILFASGNAFTELPRALGGCAQLEMVGLRANRIRHVPAEALPPRLRWLILTDNRIDALPAALGDCARLQKLMLAGNALQALPDTLARCQSLELLRLAANRFETLPSWLAQLPRLAWLAVAGNPLTAAREAAALQGSAVLRIDAVQLQLGEVLGEGASGVIQAAQWRHTDGTHAEAVAVKRFKGALTSDGWPASEMAASLAAGTHAGLIGVRARVADPSGGDALVLARLGPEWRPLAGPPDFASCTRDVYAPATHFDGATVRRVAADVASAVAHLHARGLMHGDLYAHNILWRAGAGAVPSQALLGDLGAAALLPDARLRALQGLEARAFGCLLEELLAHGPAEAALDDLRRWRDACLLPDPAARPDFAALARALR